MRFRPKQFVVGFTLIELLVVIAIIAILAAAPAECTNAAGENPAIVERLSERLSDWKATLPEGCDPEG